MPQPQPPRGAVSWPPWTAWLAWISGSAVTFVGGVFVAIIAVAAGVPADDDLPPGLQIGLTLFQNVAFLGAALVFARLSGGPPRARDFGLVKAGLGRAIGLLVAVWIAFFVLSAIWALALSLDEKQELPEQLGAGDSLANTILVVFLLTIAAPLGEELFFRGYFFAALKNWRGVLPAAILTGVVFGAMHAGSAPVGFLVPLALFGIGLCLLYHWTKSLYPCIALHALNNSVAVGVALNWSWEIPVTMAGSVVGTLTIAWLIGRLLDRTARAPLPVAAT